MLYFAVLSPLAATMRVPSALNDAECRASVCPFRVQQIEMAQPMDVVPFPAAQLGLRACQQGECLGDVVVQPFLVGHLHRPAMLDARESPPRLLFGISRGLGVLPCLFLAFVSRFGALPERHEGDAEPGEGN